MFHYSGTRPATPGMGVSENMQLQASIGLQLAPQSGFTGTASVGTLMATKDRRYEESYTNRSVSRQKPMPNTGALG